MALRQPVTKTLTCQNCQRWVLRSFISSIGGNSTPPPRPFLPQRRSLSRTAIGYSHVHQRIGQDDHPLNDINDAVAGHSQSTPPSEPAPSAQEAPIPWYLQVQRPIQREENPLASRQRIPDIPEHPPPLLQPLLNHVSIELGLDDLTLLDLRALDPPPALGANLLMIIGTARSEKHLHVSADRLCRWLRTEYKLSPYADGLLGRNELKLKMRRKAKRSRLLSAVGAKATAEGEIDDGIRTGWVCVNVGRIEGGELPKEMEKVQRREGIVGFGARTDGSNIVVQMMTEEKRGDIDLEKLWTGVLNRAKIDKEKESGGDDAIEGNGRIDITPASSQSHQMLPTS